MTAAPARAGGARARGGGGRGGAGETEGGGAESEGDPRRGGSDGHRVRRSRELVEPPLELRDLRAARDPAGAERGGNRLDFLVPDGGSRKGGKASPLVPANAPF